MNDDGDVKNIKELKELTEHVKFTILRDHWRNDKLFKITDGNKLKLNTDINDLIKKMIKDNRKTLILYIKPSISIEDNYIIGTKKEIDYKTETIAVTFSNFVDEIENHEKALTTDFYLHG